MDSASWNISAYVGIAGAIAPSRDKCQFANKCRVKPVNRSHIRHLTGQSAGSIVTHGSSNCMRIGRTILAFLVALSLTMLPMARAVVAVGDEAMASDVMVEAAPGCDHEAMDSDVVVPPEHDCCDHGSMPADHAMKECSASGACIAKCCSFYAVLYSETAVPSLVGGTESHFVSNPFYSQTGSPPYRPPRG